jgi:pantoate kinase
VIRAYAPSHITGFFEIIENKDQRRMGSVGCGVVLEKGCVTKAELSDEFSILINDREEDAPTTRYVVEKLATESVRVSSSFDVLIGSGFGASGSGALSAALALNTLFERGMTLNEIGEIAHVAEVENGTGLGDVIAQICGGVVIRKKAGAPGIGVIDLIPTGDEEVGYIVLGPISTKSILEDKVIRKRINTAGRNAMKELLRRPTFLDFVRLSKDFAMQMGLMSEKAEGVIEAVESKGGLASVAMLGDTIFAVPPDSLAEFGEFEKSRISHGGARLL